jgi:hypothetical protein
MCRDFAPLEAGQGFVARKLVSDFRRLSGDFFGELARRDRRICRRTRQPACSPNARARSRKNRCGPFGPPWVRIPPPPLQRQIDLICWDSCGLADEAERRRLRQRTSAHASSGLGSFPRHSPGSASRGRISWAWPASPMVEPIGCLTGRRSPVRAGHRPLRESPASCRVSRERPPAGALRSRHTRGTTVTALASRRARSA